MNKFLDAIRSTVKKIMAEFANFLNEFSVGLIKPWHITLISFMGHFLVLWALWYQQPVAASIFLIAFGLMDSLDGALARVQNSSSKTGIILDATSDRLKEMLLYTGLTVFVLLEYRSLNSVWLPAAVLGTSLTVSYIKAKGEMIVSGGKKLDPQILNRLFSDGFASYEVRMAIVVIGLLINLIVPALYLLLFLNCFTIVQRYVRISNYIDEDS